MDRSLSVPHVKMAALLGSFILFVKQVSWLTYHRISSAFSRHLPQWLTGARSWITVTGSPEILTPFPFKIRLKRVLHLTKSHYKFYF